MKRTIALALFPMLLMAAVFAQAAVEATTPLDATQVFVDDLGREVVIPASITRVAVACSFAISADTEATAPCQVPNPSGLNINAIASPIFFKILSHNTSFYFHAFLKRNTFQDIFFRTVFRMPFSSFASEDGRVQ